MKQSALLSKKQRDKVRCHLKPKQLIQSVCITLESSPGWQLD